MKKKFSIIQIVFIFCFLFFQTFLVAQKDIYLVIGQSNAAGRATIEAEDMVTLTGVDLYNGTAWESAVNTAAADGGLNRYSTIQNPSQDQGLNFAYTFGRMLNEVTGDQIGLVVNARGGTSINSWAKGHTDDYYGEAINEITAALALGGSTLKGVLWHQGESDRNDAGYIAKLTTLISDLRTDLGIATLPVIVGQLSMQRTDNGTFNSNIEAFAVSNTDYAATDGLQTLDRTHFNSNAQRVLGYRYAAKVLEMVYGYTYIQNEIMYVTEDGYVRSGTN
ncbi:sialate O-acetylesterase [Xanthomarina sp. GH4-25]|uniref:sialate O-acetylesterase n=1 Tax=Xanthomarina sp. GH4-25 TaxID=3349335 RepID=UPI0038784452